MPERGAYNTIAHIIAVMLIHDITFLLHQYCIKSDEKQTNWCIIVPHIGSEFAIRLVYCEFATQNNNYIRLRPT